MRTNLIVLSITVLILLLPSKLYAQNSSKETQSDTLDYQWDKFSISVGGFLTSLNNGIVIGSEQLGLGVALNLEDALGLKTSVLVMRSDLEYSFGKRDRHNIKLDYVGFFRSATKDTESELTIGGETFPIGTKIQTRYDLQIIRASYKYNYFIDKRVKLGASFGFFVMPISFSAKASGSSTKAADLTAPLPVLGLDAYFNITPKISIRQSLEFLYLNFDDFTGSLNDVNLKVEYHPWKHLGLGLGYNYYQMHLIIPDASDSLFDFVGDIKSGYTGILFYAKYRF